MSTPANRKGRRKLALLATLVGALGAFLALGGNAFGAVSCSYSSLGSATSAPATLTIIISDGTNSAALTNAADNTVTISRTGSVILVNGGTCNDGAFGAATITNTDQINVIPSPLFGADGNDRITIDQTNGPFAPGFTQNETPGSLNEIEFFMNLGGERTSTVAPGLTSSTTGNRLTVLGLNVSDGITAGQDGGGTFWDGVPVTLPAPPGAQATPNTPVSGDFLVNLNAGNLTDGDADVWVVNRQSTSFGNFGNGTCSANGGAPDVSTDCSINGATFNLNAGNDTFNGKGGDGTGQAVCGSELEFAGDLPEAGIFLIIDAGPGDDFIIGGECADFIVAGGGNDFIDGNGPDDTFPSCLQNEFTAVYEPSSDGDLVDFSALAGPLTIVVNANGSITVTGTTITVVNTESVIGSAGNDTITGNGNPNFLGGAGGDDTISGGGGDDVISGDDTNAQASVAGNPGNDTLAGDSGSDCVQGGPGDDTLNENTGVNTGTGTDAINTNGADALDGGPGTDTVLYDTRTTNIVVYLGLISTFNDGADTNSDGLTNEFDDVFFTTENVKTGSGQDLVSANFTNNRANNVFTDNAGNDCLEGGPGNDTFITGSAPQGADVMIGNTGADLADYSARTGAVQVALDGVANDGDIATNEGDNVGGFSVSCRPATIVVNPPVGVFGAFDVSTAGAFTDTPVPGPAPNCFLTVADQDDIPGFCNLGEQVGGDQSPLVNVDVENVNGGAGDDWLVGNGVGNVLNGNGGADLLQGGASNDQLNGGDGDDTINPGPGNDAVAGGGGTNTVDYEGAGAGGVGVTVNLLTGVASGDGNDTLKEIANVNGSSFSDAISGDANNNTLNGRGGADSINGNGGDDNVNGGDGNDQLKGAQGADRIAGGPGADNAQGGAQNDWLQGGGGKDTLLGQRGDDQLYGNANPDFLNGGPGRDRCKPGSPGLARGDVVVNCER